MQRPGSSLDEMPQLSGSIPSSLSYGVESSAGLPGRRSLINYASENAGTFGPSNNIVRIPVSAQPGFLDLKEARLAFDLTCGTVASALDGGAHCIIQRLRVLSVTGLELERIESYNLIHTIFEQYGINQDEALQLATLSGAPKAPFGISGYLQSSADALKISELRHFEIRLRNGWFNPTLGKLLPPQIGFTLELTLGPTASCLNAATSSDYTATNFYLKIPSVLVDDQGFMDRVRMLQQRGSEWNATTYKLYTATLGPNTNQQTMQISDRSYSLAAFIGCLRLQANVNLVSAYKNSQRSIQYLSSYQFTIGSQLYPPTQINSSPGTIVAGGTAAGKDIGGVDFSSSTPMNISQAFAEVKRVFGMEKGIITANAYWGSEVLNTGTEAGTNGCGIFAVDCKSYHNDRRTTSGIDTASQAVPITLNISLNGAANANVQCDIFAMCDVKFVMMPGGEIRSMV